MWGMLGPWGSTLAAEEIFDKELTETFGGKELSLTLMSEIQEATVWMLKTQGGVMEGFLIEHKASCWSLWYMLGTTTVRAVERRG